MQTVELTDAQSRLGELVESLKPGNEIVIEKITGPSRACCRPARRKLSENRVRCANLPENFSHFPKLNRMTWRSTTKFGATRTHEERVCGHIRFLRLPRSNGFISYPRAGRI
jgi:hypothetical protein